MWKRLKIWLFYVKNPLCKYPPKNKCFCGGKLTAEMCCRPFLMRKVPKKLAKMLDSQWNLLIARRVKLPKPEFQGEPRKLAKGKR